MSAFNRSGFNVSRLNEEAVIDLANYAPNPDRTIVVPFDRVINVEQEDRTIEVSV